MCNIMHFPVGRADHSNIVWHVTFIYKNVTALPNNMFG